MSDEDPPRSSVLPGCVVTGGLLATVLVGTVFAVPGSLGELVGLSEALLLTVGVGGVIVAAVVLLTRTDVGWRALARVGRWLPGHAPLDSDQSGELPAGWEQAIRQNVGLYARLSADEQAHLRRLIQAFLPGKEWVGCAGLEVTDEMKATVAAQACVLLLGTTDHDHFASVKSLLIYPSTFNTPTDRHGMEDQVATLGQAWYRGPVLLAWDEVLAGGRDPDGGRNVVYHEFAHQLDFAGESLQQATAAGAAERRRLRGEVLQAEYDALVRATQAHRVTLLDGYGATNPREFFAVATECFFEKPREMRQRHPKLYQVLGDFYQQDPAARLARHRRG